MPQSSLRRSVQRSFTRSESQGHRPHPLLRGILKTVTGLDSLRPAGRIPTSVPPPLPHVDVSSVRVFRDRSDSVDLLKRCATRIKTVQTARSNSKRKQISCPIIGIQESYRGGRKLRTNPNQLVNTWWMETMQNPSVMFPVHPKATLSQTSHQAMRAADACQYYQRLIAPL
jgi:hypothetical protein